MKQSQQAQLLIKVSPAHACSHSSGEAADTRDLIDVLDRRREAGVWAPS